MPAAEPHAAAEPLAALLAGRYRDPDTGAPLGVEARAVVLEDSLDGAEAELVAPLAPGRALAVVCDVDTAAALGDRVARALAGRFAAHRVTLPRAPRADAATLARLDAAVPAGINLVVAVGGGTINDLCKLVAHRRGVPQVVFATAPSMNGYTSVSASLLDGGVARSVRTATPVGAFFDLGVLAAAPLRLRQAGLGDSLCRGTAQADWLLAHRLLDRPYRRAPFALLADDEAALLADVEGLRGGSRAAVRHLVRLLVLSGFGMTLCGGSFPASQGEHLLAHYVAMRRPPGLPDTLHGEQVGVCTVAAARLQARWLARRAPPRLRPSALTRDAVLARFGPTAGDSCWREVAPKLLDAARADALTARLAAGWDALRDELAAVTRPPEQVQAALRRAGAPDTPAALGWPPALLDEALRHAREVRDRYTFLDLDADAAP